MSNEFKKVISTIYDDENIVSSSVVGFCREWTKRIIQFLKSKYPDIKVEAREVDITPNLQHTFPLISIDDDKYIIDGVGTAKHPPYIGSENSAPKHLQNSKPDIINKYI